MVFDPRQGAVRQLNHEVQSELGPGTLVMWARRRLPLTSLITGCRR